MNDQPTHRSHIFNTAPGTLPLELFQELLSWDLIIKSPYGYSYYNAPVDWDYKAPGSLRISDHWNFSSQGKLHCQTSLPVENNTHWTLAKFNGQTQKYDIIKSIAIPKEVITGIKSFKLNKLYVKYDQALVKTKLTNEQKSLRLQKEANSKMELNFLNQYFKILEYYK